MKTTPKYSVRFNAIRVVQPIGAFYVGVIPACILKNMAAADVRRISERELELYAGVQRGLSRSRTVEIDEFIRAVDAAFPNSIILNVESKNVVAPAPQEETSNRMDAVERNAVIEFEIEGKENTFKIIDGQHRLAGFQDDNCDNFDLVVTLFIDLVLEEQAYLFSTINLKQTKVNKSLVYDLFDVAETRSPQKTAHNIVKMLNSDKDSPFYRRIKLLGVTPKTDGIPLYTPILTQGTVVDRLLGLISRHPNSDRNLEKEGKKPPLNGHEIENGLIFRPAYIEDKEWAIYKVMINYFGAVASSFAAEWKDPDNPLARTIGFGALMRLLIPLYRQGFQEKDLSAEYFNGITKEMYINYRKSGRQLTFSEFPAAGSGELELFRYLSQLASNRAAGFA